MKTKMKIKKKPLDRILSGLVWLSAGITFFVLVYMIGYILIKGIPYLKPSLFALKYNSENVSLFPSLVTTIIMVLMALCISVPFGVFTAIYLVEYAKKGNRIVKLVKITTETLSGIPSIVYALFGSLFFVVYLGWGLSLISGSFTLAIMILPLIMRTTEESLKAVPDIYREGSFGLGAGRLRTVFKIVLPTAAPGILAGVILAVGRIVGETAALIYTAGTFTDMPKNVFSSGRTLAVHMYQLSGEGLYTGQAHATAVILLFMVIGINTLSTFVAKKIAKR